METPQGHDRTSFPNKLRKHVHDAESVIVCPHCSDPIIIEKLNCGIFRHGVVKKTGKQIDPHSAKEVCDDLKSQDLIYGCGKPFQIVDANAGNSQSGSNFIVSICDYI